MKVQKIDDVDLVGKVEVVSTVSDRNTNTKLFDEA